MLNDFSVDGNVLSVSSSPLGWHSIFENRKSACIAAPSTTKVPDAPAPVRPSTHHCMVRSEPPWVQFDRDANDALIGGDMENWNNLGDVPYQHYPTCGDAQTGPRHKIGM